MESLGYGYVQFDNDVNVENFLVEYNGIKLNDQEISVEKFVPPSQRAKPHPKNLYLKQFPEIWTEEQVKTFITEDIGNMSKIDSQGVFMDKKLKRFYCFVSFETIEGAQLVIEQFNEKILVEGADPLYVGVAESKAVRRGKIMKMRQDMRNETNLYVRSLKEDVTEESFRAVFSVYGEITSICLKKWIMKPNPQNENDAQADKNLKFGFVNFSKPEEATKAFNEYKDNETLREMVDPGNSSSFVFFFQPKRVRDGYKRMTNMNRRFMQGMHMGMPMNMNMNMNMNMGMMPQGFQMNRGKNYMPRNNMPRNMMPHMGNQNFNHVPAPNMPNMNAQTNISRTPRTERSFQNSTNQSYNNNPAEVSISQQIESMLDIQEKANVIADKKEDFEALSEDEKKNILGNIMFTRVKDSYHGKEEDLPKITGMLIDLEVLDLDEILDIIRNDDTLKERLEEAVEVLEDSD
jgi:polyadenylate-binding protein